MTDTAQTVAFTIADDIAHAIVGGGVGWLTEDGKSLHELCTETYDASVGRREGQTRYLFGDDSAIVACEGGWDVEGDEPWSWRG